MSPFPQIFQFLVVAVAGWINQQQRDVIDYLQEENRVLREQLGPGRLRFTDAQRRRLAAKATSLGRRVLRDLQTLVTPDTAPTLDPTISLPLTSEILSPLPKSLAQVPATHTTGARLVEVILR